jgi:hypothetical protein
MHVSLTVVFVACGGPQQGELCLETSYRINYNLLYDLLDNVDWSIVYKQPGPSQAFDTFHFLLKKQINISKKQVIVKRKNIKIKPWITDSLCRRIEIRNKLFKKMKSKPNDIALKTTFNRYRNNLLRDIRVIKNEYYRQKIENCRGNSKAMWNTLKNLTGQYVKKSEILNLEIDGKIVNNPETIANNFNNYFLNVVENVVGNDEVPEQFHGLEVKNTFRDFSERSSMFLCPVSSQELEIVIKSLKNGKSPGIDDIGSFLIKSIYPKIADVLLYIVNFSFESGVFPERMKEAVVIPIHKKGSKMYLNNYRPISLLMIFSKILEKIMKRKLLNFLNKTDFFSKNQFGFREKMNTESALLKFITEVSEGLNSQKRVSGLFLDITKAFDTVDHIILLRKLYNTGIRGVVYKWFRSYLLGRKQCVRINGVYSKMGEVKYGVPQGSVLGAVLFLIYINDLCNARFLGKLTSFADDTALCYVMNSWDDVERAMNSDLQALRWWFTKNKMVLSPGKTNYINFSLRVKSKVTSLITYKCIECLCKGTLCDTNCVTVESCDFIKYLGVMVDNELNWKNHLSHILSKLNNTIRLFYFLRKMCPINVMRTLYFAFIHSRLEYGIICWGGYLQNKLKISHYIAKENSENYK